jgi:carbon-monoxide dehydrogenase small subunit
MALDVSLKVNGELRRVGFEPSMSLMDLLRDVLGYKGAKVCCNAGECGACTVLLNGRLVNSCVVLAADAADAEIVTVEGLARDGRLHPIQEAFIEAGAVQCGYCTPGFIMAAKALLDQKSNPTVEEIKEGISGNICRCTGYTKIIEAIQIAARETRARR